jgi:hypothetical protein
MLLSSDPVTRITRRLVYNESDGTGHIISEQDERPVVEENKALFNSYRGRWEKHGEYADRYASIPLVIWGDLIAKGIAYDDERLAAWLDDPENQAWRTRPGKIGKRKIRRHAA